MCVIKGVFEISFLILKGQNVLFYTQTNYREGITLLRAYKITIMFRRRAIFVLRYTKTYKCYMLAECIVFRRVRKIAKNNY